ncbi:hypothetical protein BGZ95_005738, partial [Linnemannia exigua]
MEDELDKLIEAQWGFLHQDWPVVKRTKFHRTDIKPIQDMRRVGPYRNVEKGVLILYMLLQGTTVSDMGEFLPKSTFHDIIKSFFGTNTHALGMKLTSCLVEMCSSIKLRLLCSRPLNPETFKHITLHLGSVIAASDTLTSANFCYPICKRRGIELTEEESRYNAVFGSFRSRVESNFGDMQTTFTKFSHTVVNRVSVRSIFSLQYKLCCLLLNIKRM